MHIAKVLGGGASQLFQVYQSGGMIDLESFGINK